MRKFLAVLCLLVVPFSAHGDGLNVPVPPWSAPTTWVPTDASGAALAFSSVTAHYAKTNRVCTGYLRLTYPSTADVSVAKISLPCTSISAVGHAIGSCWTTAVAPNEVAIFSIGAAVANASLINLAGAGGTATASNADLSTIVLSCSFSFVAL